MKIQGCLMQVHLIEIHQVLGEKKNRSDTFLTEEYFVFFLILEFLRKFVVRISVFSEHISV